MINTLPEKLHLLEEMGVDYVVLQTFDREFAKCDREKFIDDILIDALGVKEIFVEKLHLLEEMGVDYVVLQTFDREFAKCDREKFIDDILIDALGVKEIFVGFNYTFGERGAGNTEYLKNICCEKGFAVNEVPPVEYKGYVLSSTLIRDLILKGELELANCFLGRPFLISEIVEHGKKYGRLLGFPTANLKVLNKVYPPFGIFGGSTVIEGRKEKYSSVVNIGKNPTLKPGELSVEVHILDFSEDSY